MRPMKLSMRFAAPPRKTFEVCADFRNADQRIKNIKRIEVLTDGPIRKGTRFRETRVMFNRECTEEMELVEFQPDSSYTLGCASCGAEWRHRFDFASDGNGGTVVNLEMSCRAVSLFAKLMSPLGALFAGSLKKCVQQDLDDLRKVIES